MALAPHLFKNKAYKGGPAVRTGVDGSQYATNSDGKVVEYKVEYYSLADQGYDLSQYVQYGGGGSPSAAGAAAAPEYGYGPSSAYDAYGYGAAAPQGYGYPPQQYPGAPQPRAHGPCASGRCGYSYAPAPAAVQQQRRGPPAQPRVIQSKTILFDEQGRKFGSGQGPVSSHGMPVKKKQQKPYGWWNYPGHYEMSEW